MRIHLRILCLAGFAFALLAQDSHPSCNKCSGTYISERRDPGLHQASARDAVVPISRFGPWM